MNAIPLEQIVILCGPIEQFKIMVGGFTTLFTYLLRETLNERNETILEVMGDASWKGL